MDGCDKCGSLHPAPSLGASLLSIIVTVTLRVTIDYFRLFVPTWEIGPLCYNGFQRYCHGLLVTR